MATAPVIPSNPSTDAGMTFDSAPVSAATPVPSLASAPSSNPSTDAGMVFDSAPVKTALSVPAQQSQTQATPSDANGSFLHNLNQGIGKGLDETFAPIEQVMHKVPGLGSVMDATGGSAQLAHDKQEAAQPVNGVGGALGYTGENIGEFLLGDEALKGLSLGDRLLKSGKVAKMLEDSPRLAKAVEIGMNAMRAGTIQGAISTVKSDGNVEHGLGQGALSAGTVGALSSVAPTISAIRSAFDASGIQQPLQDSIRNIVGDAADKLGVSRPTSTSIRDAVQDVQQQLKAKASQMYQKLDTISGGQAQRFRDAAENVSNKLGDIVGLDDDKEAELVAQQQKIDAAHKAMLDKLEAQGYDRNMLQQADAAWAQQSSLSDLNNAVRQTTSGLRPDLAAGVKGATTAEAVNPKTLFVRINRLNDSGRLAQAIGQDNANALLQHVDSAYVQAQKIAAKNRWAGKLVKAVGYAGLAGLTGATGYTGYHLAHELLSNH